MPKKRRRNWPLTLIALFFVVTLIGYVFVQPIAIYGFKLSNPNDQPFIVDILLYERVMYRAFEFFMSVWFFFLGASLGSFLNVVIYRTPRGITLLGSSRCPYCRTSIRSYDNIPLFAWLSLRGRCRACRLPISARYPSVELAIAIVFIALAIGELFFHGANLPLVTPLKRYGLIGLVRNPDWNLATIYASHCFLVTVLLSWALIRFDGFKVPGKYLALTLVLGFAFPAINPKVHPVAWMKEAPAWLSSLGDWISRVDTGLVGCVIGGLLGVGLAMIAVQWQGAKQRSTRGDAIAGFAVVGLYLGWQAALSIGLLVAWSCCMTAVIGRLRDSDIAQRIPLLGHLTGATFLHILAWRFFSQITWWPGANATLVAIGVACGVTVFLATIARVSQVKAEVI